MKRMRLLFTVAVLFAFVPRTAAQALIGDTLSVKQGEGVDQADDNRGTLDPGLKFGQSETIRFVGKPGSPGTRSIPSGEGIASTRTAGANRYGIDLYTHNVPRVSITWTGRVGIGTTQPSRALDVRGAGDVEIGLQSTDTGGRLWTIQSSRVTGIPLDQTFQIIDRTLNIARLLIYPNGTVSVGVLQITGGADIAEPFDISTKSIAKGSVVIIDEEHAGQLKRSERAYDNRVAGILSGANGIEPGISLRQRSVNDEGKNVALSGRVYALADATEAPIKPGDLLTTSDIPGHCMKVTNYAQAQGAILGKAMSALDSGTGMVLVLVGLQ